MFLHPYNVDRWSLSGETYAKIDGWVFFSASIQKSQVPSKKQKIKRSNKCSGYHLNLVAFLAWLQKVLFFGLVCFRPLIKTGKHFSLIRAFQVDIVYFLCSWVLPEVFHKRLDLGAYKCFQFDNIGTPRYLLRIVSVHMSFTSFCLVMLLCKPGSTDVNEPATTETS